LLSRGQTDSVSRVSNYESESYTTVSSQSSRNFRPACPQRKARPEQKIGLCSVRGE